MPELTLDREKTALLIADFYADMMGMLPHAKDRKVVEKTRSLQRAALDAGILVCYSTTVFRPGYIEISDRNKTLSQRRSAVYGALRRRPGLPPDRGGGLLLRPAARRPRLSDSAHLPPPGRGGYVGGSDGGTGGFPLSLRVLS